VKIGFFTDRFYPQVDGVAVSVDIFARELIKLGHEVTVFCPQAPNVKHKDPDYVVRFRSIPSFWYEGHRDTMPFTSANIEMVESYGFDIVHVHTPAQVGILGMKVAKENGIPIVITHHTDIDQYTRIYKKVMLGVIFGILVFPAILKNTSQYKQILSYMKPKRSLGNWNRRLIIESVGLLYNGCDAVIVPSEKMRESLKDYGYNKHVDIIPSGIDLNEAKLGKNVDARKKFGIAKDAPLLLSVGRLGEEKNVQLIIKSMPKITEQLPDARLLVVGDGPYAEDLVDLAKQLGVEEKVVFTGMLNRSDTFACFNTADVFCFASVTDTQGLVLNEAGIKSMPIVFVDEGISPVAIDGKAGIRAKNTLTSFSNACLKLLKNPGLAEKYGRNAYELTKTITIAKQAEKLLDVYRRLLR
jgi:1,2-diacylglycerol 3-alpha-glucosyltransferase